MSFDDNANLAALAFVDDYLSALQFAFDGQAGPLGRPIALASFVLNASSWPSAPQDFLYVNTLIHLLNGLLVTWISYRLARKAPWITDQQEWFAVTVGCLWVSSPLLMSTSLMTIQRMTSLSATFSLLAVLVYIVAWARTESSPRAAFLVMGASVAIGTGLAMLTKEIGALLPLYIWIIHRFILAPQSERSTTFAVARSFTPFKVVFFYLPAIVFAIYAVRYSLNADSAYSGRTFNLYDRVLTESRILFKYVSLIALPDRSALGPFHDDYVVSRGLRDPPITMIAVLGWVAVVVACCRSLDTEWRIVTFGMAWFLIGHLLESTIFALELYFEHRNYLPSFGVIWSIAAAFWHPRITKALRFSIVCILIAYSLFVSRENGLIWGRPLLAGALWHSAHPESERAITYYSRAVAETGDFNAALEIMDSVRPEIQETPSFAVAKLLVYCGMKAPEAVSLMAKQTNAVLAGRSVDFDVPVTLTRILDLVREGKCRGIQEEDVLQMLEKVVVAPEHLVSTRAYRAAHNALSAYWLRQRNLNATMHHLERSFEYRKSIDTGEKMVLVLLSAGLCDSAAIKLEQIQAYVPLKPFVREQWLKRIKILASGITSCKAQNG